jgi:hypothetical protein
MYRESEIIETLTILQRSAIALPIIECLFAFDAEHEFAGFALLTPLTVAVRARANHACFAIRTTPHRKSTE